MLASRRPNETILRGSSTLHRRADVPRRRATALLASHQDGRPAARMPEMDALFWPLAWARFGGWPASQVARQADPCIAVLTDRLGGRAAIARPALLGPPPQQSVDRAEDDESASCLDQDGRRWQPAPPSPAPAPTAPQSDRRPPRPTHPLKPAVARCGPLWPAVVRPGLTPPLTDPMSWPRQPTGQQRQLATASARHIHKTREPSTTCFLRYSKPPALGRGNIGCLAAAPFAKSGDALDERSGVTQPGEEKTKRKKNERERERRKRKRKTTPTSRAYTHTYLAVPTSISSSPPSSPSTLPQLNVCGPEAKDQVRLPGRRG
ncbi:hypothetical protein CDD83_7492 [Cordyceps sp. RAO-2017]|nr:hypothetical protein CDD83_7492 [Cordyceps sp. RAO-2017]